ncbi:MAG: winged helix-turn-helix transcriptional regulator [Planctomycetes bacterium]|nr:winged helix-turn-helix transcriptional regulator [Planctomycetota bacterium]MCP4769895.1 winged helix-turn-helix transcriptional regulator [Planctomycetota bacterium]MCP4859735.1 winged helix-turn-helix transcriptional regulator [Planctomycetota bacterium]
MKEKHFINTLPQLKAFESHIRLLIVDWLLTHGPLSARELATGMGMQRTAIYHHFKILLKAGLIEKAETEDGDKYQTVAVNFLFDRNTNTPEWNKALGDMAGCILRNLIRRSRVVMQIRQ